jgi:hypothetical protein
VFRLFLKRNKKLHNLHPLFHNLHPLLRQLQHLRPNNQFFAKQRNRNQLLQIRLLSQFQF